MRKPIYSKESTENEQRELIPVGVDLVRFEKNLLQTGFFGAHDLRHSSETIRKYEMIVIRDGQKMKVGIEFRSTLGLPSTIDRDKYLAFMRIASEQKAKQGGAAQNPIRFSGYRLLKELGVKSTGEAYEDINIWGQRMADTTITSEEVIYMAARKKYANKTIHVFKSFQRLGKSDLDGNRRTELFAVELEDWFLENFNQNYVVPEDFNAYQKLKRPTAKGVFGHLHIWFHSSKGRSVERDYADLCKVLNIPSYRFLSKIRSTMGKALDELVSIGYLSSWDIRPMITKEGYKLVLSPGENIMEVLAISQRNRKDSQPSFLEPSQLTDNQGAVVESLIAIGISDAKATEMVRRGSLESVIDQMEYAQFLIRSDKRGKITNPAGFVIYAIESKLPIPVDFVTTRRSKIELDRLESDRRASELEEEYKQELKDHLNGMIEARFPGKTLDEKIRQVLDQRSPVDRQFDEFFPKQSREIAKQILREDLQAEMSFPSLEEWCKQQKQLF